MQKINEKRRIRTQIRKEQNELNERIESFKLAHPQWEAFKHEPFTSEPYISSEVDLGMKINWHLKLYKVVKCIRLDFFPLHLHAVNSYI